MRYLIITVCAVSILFAKSVRADEGMWLLPMIEKLNIGDMQKQGFKLSAQDIFDVNKNSLKDAIVIFAGGCTGEIVSPDGLLFTNHHCGFGAIQQLSSVEHDYLKNGFWAMNRAEELATKGLKVEFIRHIEDVTKDVIPTAKKLSEKQRDEKIDANISKVQTELSKKYPKMTIEIKPFFGGNQYIAFAKEIYSDVRLVGTPPYSIGKFGGETDNWMYPRHTGDFSVFRVYADKDGRPAEYSADNVPYKAPTHLAISLKGYDEGDYAMVLGFPGSTSRYMTSWEIDEVLQVINPARIYLRGVRQEILDKRMKSSDKIRIQYASKYAGSSNYWKNSIGMSKGLRKLKVKEEKQAVETQFTEWVKTSDGKQYAQALPLISTAVEGRAADRHSYMFINEGLIRSVEILSAARSLSQQLLQDTINIDAVIADADEFYKDYDQTTDQMVAKEMFRIVKDSLSSDILPVELTTVDVDAMYRNSIFANKEKFEEYIANPDTVKLSSDPAVVVARAALNVNAKLRDALKTYDENFSQGHRLFVAGVVEMDKSKKHYPDANFTLRMSFGNVLSYSPADATTYSHYTTLSGVIEKEDLTNPTDFTVPEKLKELHAAKDFGQYAYNGDVPVTFLTNNDITGGNSGSPVLNDKGELIGLAFDGNWEAMSGDIAFDHKLKRCINVDVRYVLFIIDKFAGASYLLDEMTIK